MRNEKANMRNTSRIKNLILILGMIGILLIPKMAEAVTVSVSDAEGQPGQSGIPVAISVRDVDPDEIDGADSIGLLLDYNTNLIAEDVTIDTVTPDWEIFYDIDNAAGQVDIALFRTSPLAATDGCLAVINFSVDESAQPGDADLIVTLAIYNPDFEEIYSDAVNGTFVIINTNVDSPVSIPEPGGDEPGSGDGDDSDSGDSDSPDLPDNDNLEPWNPDDPSSPIPDDGDSLDPNDPSFPDDPSGPHIPEIDPPPTDPLPDPESDNPYPWDFDPQVYGSYPYYYPLHGTAMLDGAHLSAGDWVGVFDADGNCYGAGEYQFDGTTSKYHYSISAYAASADDGLSGFSEDDAIFFKFYIAATGEEIDAVPSPFAIYKYPPAPELTDPAEINLINAKVQDIPLAKGWNFISFSLQPADPQIENAFSSVLDNVEYICDHMHWWKYGLGGSLTEVIPYHSYYIKTTADCTLTIAGTAVELPHSLDLSGGWNSISYPYDEPAFAVGRTEEPLVYTGFFKGIIDNIVWVKGPASWCTPEVDDVRLEVTDGLFIKLRMACELTFPDER